MDSETFQPELSWTQSAAKGNNSQQFPKHLGTKSEEKQKFGLCFWAFYMEEELK